MCTTLDRRLFRVAAKFINGMAGNRAIVQGIVLPLLGGHQPVTFLGRTADSHIAVTPLLPLAHFHSAPRRCPDPQR